VTENRTRTSAASPARVATNFLYPRGIVYVFENSQVKRVKVGMTGIGVNSVSDRLRDGNDMWLERKVTCQICGGRLVNVGGFVPNHVAVAKNCLGGAAPPLERDVGLAASYLESMRSRSIELHGTERGSIVRRLELWKRELQGTSNTLGQSVFGSSEPPFIQKAQRS
jgi:hypothetical protein